MKTLEQNDEQRLYDLWDHYQLEYTLHIHPPLFTVEDGEEVSRVIPGAHSKNLFLKDKKGNFFLISVLQDKRVNLKQLSKEVGKGGLSFGSSIDLLHTLNLVPGSVTPFGLMNLNAKCVRFILDEDFLQYEHVNFHPLRNDKTAQMLLKDFLKFFEILEHVPEIRVIPTIV